MTTTFDDLTNVLRQMTPFYQAAYNAAPSDDEREKLRRHSKDVQKLHDEAQMISTGVTQPFDPKDAAEQRRKAVASLSAAAVPNQPYWNLLKLYGEVLGWRTSHGVPRYLPAWEEFTTQQEVVDAQWSVAGNTVLRVSDGRTWRNSRPFNFLYGTLNTGSGAKYDGAMSPGEICDVLPGRYQGTHRFAQVNRKGTGWFEFRAVQPGTVEFYKSDTGGSDATYLEAAHGVRLRGIHFKKGTRAALKTESDKRIGVNHDVEILDCAISGDWDAETDANRTGGQWIYHGYHDGSSALGSDYGLCIRGHLPGVPWGLNFNEQMFYFHGIGAPGVSIDDFGVIKWTGRSAVKDSARGGEAILNGGDLVVKNGTMEDCAIGDQTGGGSYIDLSGHGGLFRCENVTFLVGENPRLHASLHKSITGIFVADTTSWSDGGDVEFINTTCRRGHAIRANRTNWKLLKPNSARHVTLTGNQWTDAPNQPFQMEISTAAWSGVLTVQVDPSQQVITGECVCNGVKFKDPQNDGEGFREMVAWLQKNHPAKVAVV